MRGKARGWLMGFGLTVLAGCTSLETSPAGVPAVSPSDVPTYPSESADTVALLQYAEAIRAMNPKALQRERSAAEQRHAKQASADGRIRLALLLSLPHAPFRNDARARSLLSQAARDGDYNAGSYRRLAAFLLTVLAERAEIEKALEDERKQRLAVQKQLQQLKAIEEDIDRRIPSTVINPK